MEGRRPAGLHPRDRGVDTNQIKATTHDGTVEVRVPLPTEGTNQMAEINDVPGVSRQVATSADPRTKAISPRVRSRWGGEKPGPHALLRFGVARSGFVVAGIIPRSFYDRVFALVDMPVCERDRNELRTRPCAHLGHRVADVRAHGRARDR